MILQRVTKPALVAGFFVWASVSVAQVNKMAKKYLDLHHAIVLIAGDTHAMHLSNHGQNLLPDLPVYKIDKKGAIKQLTKI